MKSFLLSGVNKYYRSINKKNHNKIKIAVNKFISVYVLTGVIWMFLSYSISKYLIVDLTISAILKIFTGTAFIILTACILYIIIYERIKVIRRLQNKLLQYEERYSFFVNNTNSGVWDWNIKTNEVILPLKWKESLGYEDGDIPSNIDGWKKLIHPEDFNRVLDTIHQYIMGEISVYSLEYRLLKKDGGVIWVHDEGRALWNKEGEPIQMCGTHTDITLRKETESAMSKLMVENQQLVAATLENERLQTEFFCNISHEFKTPLNVILAAIQLLDHYRLDDEKSIDPKVLVKSIGSMKKNSYRLLRLTNNLLDITKLDFNSYTINYRSYNIISIVEEITYAALAFAQKKGINVTFDTNVEEQIMGCDIYVIERIMLNLLSNAIKNTEEGSIKVNVEVEKDNIFISVKDTGRGIPANKISAIFNRFYQVDGSLNRKDEGIGIGLVLVKAFIEKVEGSIWVESQEFIGSIFTVRLPIKLLEEEETHINTMEYIKGLNEKVTIELSDIYSLK